MAIQPLRLNMPMGPLEMQERELYFHLSTWYHAAPAYRLLRAMLRPELDTATAVLDAHAHTGRFAVRLARRRRQTHVAAICGDRLHLALARLRPGHRRVRLTLPKVADNLLHLPFPDASFDVALVAMGTAAWRDDQHAVAELHRVLRPGGVVGICGRDARYDKNGYARYRSTEQPWYRRHPIRGRREVGDLLAETGFNEFSYDFACHRRLFAIRARRPLVPVERPVFAEWPPDRRDPRDYT